MESKWYRKFLDASHCKKRIFCFPHAGGSAQSYRQWVNYLPDDIELLVAQMPGRAERMQEKLCSNFNELIMHLSNAIIPFLDKSYFFVGHSLGASIAFEMARAMRRLDYPMPSRLIIIGRSAPNIPELYPKYHLSDEEFINYLKSQSGTNEKIFEDKALLNIFLPIVRNDMQLADTYHNFYQQESPLSCPIHVFWGNQEADLSQEMLEEWKNQTSSEFTVDQFEGNHFFLHAQCEKIIKKVLALSSSCDEQ